MRLLFQELSEEGGKQGELDERLLALHRVADRSIQVTRLRAPAERAHHYGKGLRGLGVLHSVRVA